MQLQFKFWLNILLLSIYIVPTASVHAVSQASSPVAQQPVPSLKNSVVAIPNNRKPRVVSINLCTDQWAIALADHEQILSLSFLAQDTDGSELWREALKFPTNRGRAEEIFGLQPDLVLAGQYTDSYTIKLLQGIGLTVEQIPIAQSVDDLLGILDRVGRLLHQTERASLLHDELTTRLNDLPERADNPLGMLIYDPNGYTAGHNTLRGDMLHRAGWRNVATDRGINTYGVLSLESVITLQPDAVWTSPYRGDTWSRGQTTNQHPALGQRGLQPLEIVVPARRTLCGGPWTIEVIEQLSRHRVALQNTQFDN